MSSKSHNWTVQITFIDLPADANSASVERFVHQLLSQTADADVKYEIEKVKRADRRLGGYAT